MTRIVSEKTPSTITPPQKFSTERIVYNKWIKTNHGPMINYRMADIKQGAYVGQMYARPVTETIFSSYYPALHSYDSFKIEEIRIEPNERRNGHGASFINIAKNESRRYNCNGRVHVNASRIFDRENPPHIFYRKQGFTSIFKNKIRYIDECIRKHKKMSLEMADNLEMYLPLQCAHSAKQKQVSGSKLAIFIKKIMHFIK